MTDGRGRGGALPPPSPVLRVAVERSDVVRELDRNRHCRLTLVVAPAGSGKTVTVEQWARGRTDVRWIAAGERARDERSFAKQVLAAVTEHVGKGPTSLGDWLDPRGDRLGEQFVDALLGELESTTEPVTLVFDDVDRLGDGAHADLRQLIAGAPRHVHVVAIARADPHLGQARLRAYGEAAEIRIEQLRFGPEQSRDLIERVSERRLDDAQLATVMSTTEGWPIAVHLAGLTLRSSDDLDASLAEFESNDRNVADFLSEEVFRQLSAGDRDLLVRTSVLPLLDGDVCDAVLGTAGSAGRLDDLERRGLLLARLPEGRYRLHRLVRAYLRLDLQRLDPAGTVVALRAAATFELARGAHEAGGDHLAEARDWPALRDLIVDSAAKAWAAVSFDAIRNWIAALPSEQRDPILQLTSVLVDIAAGAYESAAGTVADLLRADLTPEQRVVAVLASSALISSTGAFEQVRRDAAEVERLAAIVDVAGIPVVMGIPGSSAVLWARAHAAQASMFLGSSSEPESTPDIDTLAGVEPILTVNALGGYAVRAALAGRLREAESAALRVAAVASDMGHRHSARSLSLLALGMVAYSRDELDMAAEHLGEALGIVEQWRRMSWVRLVMIEQARVADALGEAGATDLTDHLTAVPAPPSTPWIEDRALAIEAAAWLRRQDRPRAEATLARRRGGPVDATVGLRVSMAIDDGDLERATSLLRTWPTTGRFDGQLRQLLGIVVSHLGGDDVDVPGLVLLVDDLERSGNVRLVVDAGDAGDRRRAAPPPGIRPARPGRAHRPSDRVGAVDPDD